MSAAEMKIRLNSGEVVTRPYREAVRLLSRRMADPVQDGEVSESDGTGSSASSEGSGVSEAQSESPGASESPADLESLNKTDLVEMARARDLPTSGTKDELIDRLSAEASASGASTGDVPSGSPDSDGGR